MPAPRDPKALAADLSALENELKLIQNAQVSKGVHCALPLRRGRRAFSA